MLRRIRRRLTLVLAVVGGVAAMLIATGTSVGPFHVNTFLSHVPRGSIFICALLIFATEVCKGARWGTFLHSCGVRIRMIDAISTSMASQALSVLPGNDMLAARLTEEHAGANDAHGPRVRQALPAIVARWCADAIALSLIVTAGMTYYRGFEPYTLLPIVLAVTVAMLLRAHAPAHWLVRRLGRWKRTQHLVRSEADFHRASRRVMRVRPLVVGVLWSMCTTALSAGVLYTLVHGFGGNKFSVSEAIIAHSLTAMASMVSFMPNGFGVADGSMAGWLHVFGIGARRIVLVTMTLRLLNIVVRTAIGVAMLLTRYRFMWDGGTRQMLRRVFSNTYADAAPALNEPAEAA